MSDGRIYGEQTNSSDLYKILEDLERKWKAISIRLPDYEAIIREAKNTDQKLEETKKELFSIKNEIEETNFDSKENYALFLEEIKKLKDSNNDIAINIGSFEKKFIEHEEKNLNTTRQICEEISSFSEKIKNIYSSCVSKVEFENSLKALLSSISKLDEIVKNIQKDFVENKKTIEAVYAEIFKHEAVHKNISNNIVYLENSIRETVLQFEQKIKQQSEVFEYRLKQEIDKIAFKNKEIKEEILGSPSSLESTKSELFKKMELISLDAFNAHLKASNNDQQVKILEKKIESINLLLKKFELEK